MNWKNLSSQCEFIFHVCEISVYFAILISILTSKYAPPLGLTIIAFNLLVIRMIMTGIYFTILYKHGGIVNILKELKSKNQGTQFDIEKQEPLVVQENDKKLIEPPFQSIVQNEEEPRIHYSPSQFETIE